MARPGMPIHDMTGVPLSFPFGPWGCPPSFPPLRPEVFVLPPQLQPGVTLIMDGGEDERGGGESENINKRNNTSHTTCSIVYITLSHFIPIWRFFFIQSTDGCAQILRTCMQFGLLNVIATVPNCRPTHRTHPAMVADEVLAGVAGVAAVVPGV